MTQLKKIKFIQSEKKMWVGLRASEGKIVLKSEKNVITYLSVIKLMNEILTKLKIGVEINVSVQDFCVLKKLSLID